MVSYRAIAEAGAGTRPRDVLELLHTFVIRSICNITFKVVKNTKTGAFNEPKRKLRFRSGLNKAKAFVQAEYRLQLLGF